VFPLLFVILAAVPAAPATHPLPTEQALQRSVDAYLQPLRACELFQGVVLVARGDRVLVSKGYGLANAELNVPNTPDRVFRIASLTKPFTELALARLADEHRLALADPLSKYLPGFPSGDSITIEMVMQHRAGIPSMNSIPYDEEAFGTNSLDSLVQMIERTPLAYPPGTQRHYSNGGYAVLAAVIEKASGVSYGDYVGHEILGPMGLLHTQNEPDGMLVVDRAFGYMPSPYRRHALVPAPYQEMNTKVGGGSLISTAADLHRFLRLAYRDGVVSADTWRHLFPPTDSTIAFQGRCPGYNLYVTRDLAHDVDVVVLANNYAAGMVSDIGDDLVALARGVERPRPAWRADVALDSAQAVRYVGSYHATQPLPAGQGPFEIRRHGDGLVFSVQGQPVDYMLPQGPGVFVLRNLWCEVRFVDDGGAAPRMTIRPLWLKGDAVPTERL
jgi:CubicO group peptidase (beta-lactamase class C family)